MANETVLIDKPAPVKPLSPASPVLPSPVGGKTIIYDGSEKKTEDKPQDKTVDKPADKSGENDLQSGLDALRERLGIKKKEEKKPEDKPQDKPADKPQEKKTEAKTEDDADRGKEGSRRVKKSRSAPQSVVTPEMVETVAQAAARAAVETGRLAKRDEKPQEQPELSDQDGRDYQVFQFLEKQDEKYKGISGKFLKFVKEFENYENNWSAENPDKEFDPNAEEHDAFYARHEPQYDPEDFENARIEMRVENKLKDRSKELDDKYSAIEAEVIEQKLAPEINNRIGESVHEMVKSVDPEAAKLILDKGSEALSDSDPIAFEAMDRAASELGQAISELEKLTHPSGKFKFNAKNPVHVWIDRFAGNLEREIKSMPTEDQIRDGRLFATAAELRQIPDSQKGRYWFLDPPTIRGELVRYYADSAKKFIELERKKLAAYQSKYGQKPSGDKDDKGGQPPEKKAEKPNSPASLVDAGAASAGKVENNTPGGPIATLVSRMFPS